MPSKVIFVGLLALAALSRPVASDAKPEMCSCELIAPRYSPIARLAGFGSGQSQGPRGRRNLGDLAAGHRDRPEQLTSASQRLQE